MDNRYDLNEAETRAELIDPALREAGWGVVPESRVRRELIAPGRLVGGGRRGKEDVADYVLLYRNCKLAVIEAKRVSAHYTEGVQQAKDYAAKLQTRFAFATNGRKIYRVDRQSGRESDVERYPTPDELWHATFNIQDAQERYWRRRFEAVPFEEKGGQWQPRYYQHNAITSALNAIASGRDRILLTLATGTGKTAIAFQIAWALFHSRWNLHDWRTEMSPGEEPRRRPRILFLADRNILANQAFNAFNAFPDDALVRILPDDIRKRGRVPKNGSLFFTIFQTFMSGEEMSGEDGAQDAVPYFSEYPPDFFDFVVIDECHRGGASDESSWRAILEYFSPAVQLGLTATPKRNDNVDTYAYFGEPIYTYSLKEGINDGYLTPFRIKQFQTTLDEYVYDPDDDVIEGEVAAGRQYGEADFNRIIEIEERERYRVETFMAQIDQRQKTLVFCATQDHALAVRNVVNQIKLSDEPDYCVRVTADDGARGEAHLRTFQDNEKSIPTILTTSRKLSTGVDARNVRNIVLLRPINSIVEFKQIIGRGTRLFDNKDYFTVYDFVRAYEHFSDPEWDGEPLQAESATYTKPESSETLRQSGADYDEQSVEPNEPQFRTKLVIKLADGKLRRIQHTVTTSFWSPSGTPMTAVEFVEALFGKFPEFFADEAELVALWSRPDTRRKLLDALAEEGFGVEQLRVLSDLVEAQQSDLFDVLAYIAFAQPPISRAERVVDRRDDVFTAYTDPMQRDFLEFVLNHYVEQGVSELDEEKLIPLIDLKYRGIRAATETLGSVSTIRALFAGFQKHLYTPPLQKAA